MLRKNPLSLAKTEPTTALSPFEEIERRFEDFIRRPFSLMEAPWWTRWPGLVGEVSPELRMPKTAEAASRTRKVAIE